jgi:glycerophosphoryl diester phosphodiesterase
MRLSCRYLCAMIKHIVYFSLMCMTFSVSAQYIPKFDLQGHRGARGIKPENTIPSFISALDHGVTTIELDVVISADKQIVVSHEPWMSAEICSRPDGTAFERSEEMKLNIYELTYEQIKTFDCGSKGNPRFPEQQKMAAVKPLLRDVMAAVEDHIKSFTQYEVDYNIELKSRPEGDNKYHPSPDEFSDRVYDLINQYLPWERVVIQSFDQRILRYWHEKYPHVRLAFLIENAQTPQVNLKELGFTPSVYSPYFKLLTREQISYIRSLTFTRPLEAVSGSANKPTTEKVRIIPWTVNEIEDMKRLKDLGVDGLITDYPNRAQEIGLGLKRNINGSNKK